MGSHKRTHCRKGHSLCPSNVVFNSEGFRECKKCKAARRSARSRKNHYAKEIIHFAATFMKHLEADWRDCAFTRIVVKEVARFTFDYIGADNIKLLEKTIGEKPEE